MIELYSARIMNCVLSHRTMALATHLPAVRKILLECQRPSPLPCNKTQLSPCEAKRLQGFLRVDERLCFAAHPDTPRIQVAEFFCRHAYKRMPLSIAIQLGNGLYAVTPEACFLQMATELTLPELVRFGYDLCGTYAPGHGDLKTTYQLDPLTSTSRIEKFLDKCPSVFGASKAKEALRYVVDGAASPREAILGALFSMPYSKGGFAQPDFEMNALFSKKDVTRFPDLYFRDLGIDIEFDSDEFHDDKTRDAIRRNQLLGSQLPTMTITSEILDSYAMMQSAFRDFLGFTGQRYRIRTKNYAEKSKALHAALTGPEWYRRPPSKPYRLHPEKPDDSSSDPVDNSPQQNA